MADPAEKETIDSNYMTALASGVFNNAADVNSGRTALAEAYDSYNWTNPDEAKKTLETWGGLLQHKFEDQTPISDIEKNAPVPITSIAINQSAGETDADGYQKWKDANDEYFKLKAPESKYIAAKQAYQDTIAAHADDSIRTSNAENRKANIGEPLAAAVDTATREVIAGTSYISDAVKTVTGYDFSAKLKQYTDPKLDNTAGDIAANALGGAASLIYSPNKVVQAAALTIPAISSVGKTYSDTLHKTGDPTAAKEAGAVEAGAQAIMAGTAQLVFGKFASNIFKEAVTAEGKAALQEALDAGKAELNGVKVTADSPTVKKYLEAPVNSAFKNVVLASTEQGAAQYVGKLGTNTASNIENQRPALQNVTEGAATSGFIGAGLAGGITGVDAAGRSLGIGVKKPTTNSSDNQPPPSAGGNDNSPPPSDTSVRQSETEEFGSPITKQIVEKVGPIQSEAPSNALDAFDQASGDTTSQSLDTSEPSSQTFKNLVITRDAQKSKLENLSEAQKNEDLGNGHTMGSVLEFQLEKNNAEIERLKTEHQTSQADFSSKDLTTPDVPDVPSRPAFVTDAGDTWHLNDEGQYGVAGAKVFHDRTNIFLDAASTERVQKAINEDQAYPYINPDNVPVLAREGQVDEEILHSKEPAVGLRPFSISKVRHPNTQEETHQNSGVGSKINKVHSATETFSPDSAGAMRRSSETAYSKYLQQQFLPDEMQAVGEEGIYKRYYSNDQRDQEIQAAHENIGKIGIDEATRLIDNESTPLRYRNALSTALNNVFVEGLANLSKDPNATAADRELLHAQFKAAAKPIAFAGSESSEAMRLRQGRTGGNPAKIVEAYEESYKNSVRQKAKEEGATPAEVHQSDQTVANTTKQIEAVQNVIDQETSPETATKTPEHIAVNEVVGKIEADAQVKVNSDLQAIAEESQHHQETIDTTTKVAERQKRKDLQALESAVGKDSTELTNALQDATDLKSLSAEESARLDEEIKNHAADAEKKANVEVTKAVKEARDTKERIVKDATERAQERVTKATEDHATNKEKSQEQLKKLSLKKRELEKSGQDASAVDQKIQAISERITKTAQKVIDAKEAQREVLDKLNTKDEADQKAEELLKELESGVEIRTSPVGKKRAISVRTKASGLDVTKLFNTKTEAYGPLSALSRAVNELAGTVKQTLGAKSVNNERITELQKRINENKVALDKTKQRDALSASDKAKVVAAKKRLAELDKAKSEATIESRIPKSQKETYTKYKERQTELNKPSSEDSAILKAAKAKLRELEKAKARAEKLSTRKVEAQKEAATAQDAVAETEGEINKFERILAVNKNLVGTQRRAILAKINVLKAAHETDPTVRGLLFSYWVENQIGGGINAFVSELSGLLSVPLHIGSNYTADAILRAKNLLTGKSNSGLMSQGNEALKAYFSRAGMLERVKYLVSNAWTTGQRVSNIIDKGELSVFGDAKLKDTNVIAHDYDEWLRSTKLSDAKTSVGKLALLVAKTANPFTSRMLKLLAASEAVSYAVHDHAFDRAAAAAYYNKGKAEQAAYPKARAKYESQLESLNAERSQLVKQGSDTTAINNKIKTLSDNAPKAVTDLELDKYLYNAEDNWNIAKTAAAKEASDLRAAGIEVSPQQEKFSSIEKYQSLRPKEIQISAYHQAAQLVANGPAAGFAGAVGEVVSGLADKIGFPAEYLSAFSNAIAHVYNIQAAYTPLGLIDTIPNSKRTYYERQLLQASALMGTAAGVGILSYLRNQYINNPNEEPFFTVMGKTPVWGGTPYSMKIGSVFIPLHDNPLGLLMAGISSAMENIRAGKDPDAVGSSVAMWGGMTMVGASIGGAGQMSMMKNVTQILDAVKGLTNGDQDAKVKLVTAITTPIKGFVPAASLMRLFARYMDNPVEYKKDIMSAVVNGIPGLQSAYGKPALNNFGEPKGTPSPAGELHRIYALKDSTDLDQTWLIDNGYHIPGITNMRFSKKNQALVTAENEYNADDAKELDYNLKYKVMTAASKDLRALVANFRQTYAGSAHSEQTQKSLTKQFNRILNTYKTNLITTD